MKDYFRLMKNYRFTAYFILTLFLVAMLLIHRYLFLYADDLYYSRDASYGLSNLPHFIVSELNSNGRVWIGLLMLAILKYNIYVFRIFNPLILGFTVYLIAKLCTFPINNTKVDSKNFLLSLLGASLFFLFLPIEIANTSIYYAACSFNYLYPTTLMMLYSYLLYKHFDQEKLPPKVDYRILSLAFFAAASTQQVGMIAIGFTVLFHLYFRFYTNKKITRNLIPYYLVLLIGYSSIIYGSLRRYEREISSALNLQDIVSGLLTTNIFSPPVAGYVLSLTLCCIFWFYTYSKKNNLPRFLRWINILLVLLLPLAMFGYIYIVLYKQYSVRLSFVGNFNSLLTLSFIAFTVLYLISLLYSTFLIALKERFAFPLFASINAIGAQIMLIAGTATYERIYKIMFPSLLLLSVFLIYSFIKFSKNKLFLSLSTLIIFLSISREIDRVIKHFNLNTAIPMSVLITLLLMTLTILFVIFDWRFLKLAMIIGLISFSLFPFVTNYYGYQVASAAQSFNLTAINAYHQSTDKSILTLRKVPDTAYGYNETIWNDMPDYMKQCYKVYQNTVIQYQS
jgi:hypothetical protein